MPTHSFSVLFLSILPPIGGSVLFLFRIKSFVLSLFRAPARGLLPALVLILSLGSLAQPMPAQEWQGPPDLTRYLGMDAEAAASQLDPSIPTPESVLGFEVGKWHIRHDLLVKYMERLAAASDRIQLTVTGRTYEDRSLLLLTISSPTNLANLDSIREQHLQLSDPGRSADLDVSTMPVVVNLGYSVHGNEPSGSNASLVVAYFLAASNDAKITGLLDQSVILLDPSLNPDGLSRFAQWANMHKGAMPVALSASREHQEVWPGGRTNHYWFDLNRDWLPAQLPESQARLAQFHAWQPNVLTDHHEMGSDSTFFFQPGVPTRKNPLTPLRNVELTEALAKFHAQAFDRQGTLYYSEEDFDDFYYGKGSTYPDLQGAVGILFEQASSRGHLRDSKSAMDGRLAFPTTIRNQVSVSFSTLEGALNHRRELLEYQRDFFREALEEGRRDSRVALIFGDPGDPTRAALLAELLNRHKIEIHRPARKIELNGVTYSPEDSFVVPLAQAQYRLIRAIFDSFTEFEEATFYDVSAWTLPMAFGLPFSSLGDKSNDLLGGPIQDLELPKGRFQADDEAYAYLFTSNGYFAPRGLYRLLAAKVVVRVATRPFSAEVDGAVRNMPLGTLVVPLGVQSKDRSELEQLLSQVAEQDGIDILSSRSGLTPTGVDLGSPSLRPLDLPKPAILVGGRTSSYEAGEAWHLLDQRFGVETALIPAEGLSGEVLQRITHLVMVAGSENELQGEDLMLLRDWVRAGGVLVATKTASDWVVDAMTGSDNGEHDPHPTPPASQGDGEPNVERKPYGRASADRAVQLIGGTLFEVDLDLSHPLAYGYTRSKLPVFRNSRIFLKPSSNPYATVAAYTRDPLLAGYVSPENLERLAGSPAVIADRVGEGTVIQMVDNPNFRAFWYGTNKLFLNGIFFGGILDRTAPGSRREASH